MSSIPVQLDKRYKEYVKFAAAMSKRVKSTLVSYCEKNHYAFSSRIKSIDSLYDKIESCRYTKFCDIDDIYAYSIIVSKRSDENSVLEFLRKTFNVIKEVNRKSYRLEPNTFKFNSTRLICTLKRAEEPEFFTIDDIKFEIQIRTAFEYAWSISLHDIVYKGDNINWKKERIASQIKANVEQLDNIIDGFNAIYENVDGRPDKRSESLGKISEWIRDMIGRNEMRALTLPNSITKCAENIYNLFENNECSEILGELNKVKNVLINSKEFYSISLYQYILLSLFRKGKIKNSDVIYHITQELLTIEPKLSELNSFVYE